MVKARRSTGRQEHPSGKLISVDDAWKKRVRAELKDLGLSQADLAEQTKLSTGTISNLLGAQTQARIAVVARIHRKFGWEEPKEDDALRRIVDGSLLISAADREMIAALVESLASKR